MKPRSTFLATTMTALVLTGSSNAADARGPVVVLRVIDHTHTSIAIMVQAQSHAERVFAAIGVRVAWSQAEGGSCGDSGFVLTMLSTDGIARESSRGEIEENLVGWASKADARAVVYPDRVRSLAVRTRRDPGVLLGRVIAHELGHLILPSGHSRTGLMARGIDSRPTSMWALFTKAQGREIRDLLGSKNDHASRREGCGG